MKVSSGVTLGSGSGSDSLDWGLGKSYLSGRIGTFPMFSGFQITLTIINRCKYKTVVKPDGKFLFFGLRIEI